MPTKPKTIAPLKLERIGGKDNEPVYLLTCGHYTCEFRLHVYEMCYGEPVHVGASRDERHVLSELSEAAKALSRSVELENDLGIKVRRHDDAN
jgi:hypothetical protein